MSAARGRRGLAARLFAAQLLVIVAGSVTLALVALGLARGLFRAHAHQALAALSPGAVDHLERAFGDAMLLALGIAAAAALATALAVSWLLALRITRPIRALAGAAEQVRDGRYEVRVPVPASGDELAVLGGAFNRMAGGA